MTPRTGTLRLRIAAQRNEAKVAWLAFLAAHYERWRAAMEAVRAIYFPFGQPEADDE